MKLASDEMYRQLFFDQIKVALDQLKDSNVTLFASDMNSPRIKTDPNNEIMTFEDQTNLVQVAFLEKKKSYLFQKNKTLHQIIW